MLAVAPYPMFRWAIVLAMGIWAFGWLPGFSLASTTILVFLGTVYFFLYFLKLPSKNKWLGVLAHLLIFLVGYKVAEQSSGLSKESHLSHVKDGQSYIAVVDEEWVSKPNSYSTRLKVKLVSNAGIWQYGEGNVLAYFPKTISKPLRYGDWLLVKEMPQPTEPPKNPQEFDYQAYLGFQNVFHVHYLSTSDFVWLQYSPENGLWANAYRVRQALTEILSRSMGGGQEFAVASMLILGIKQSIDPEIIEAYSGAGAMHILAVSGLHVGLIFGLLELLLGKFADRWRLRPLFYAMVFLVIWTFGFITAFSPSVLRAVVMFSVILLGKWLGKRGNLYNTLGCSAFLILLFSPFMLWNVGFQMSCLAVLGIAYFYRRFFGLVQIKSRVGKWIWGITCVSLSAQLITLPLSLYYFNQYPLYSLLSNLWVIPVGSCILYLGILFYAGCLFAFWKTFFGFLLHYSVKWLNESMSFVTELPFSVFHPLYYSEADVILLYGLLLSLILLFHQKTRYYLMGAMVFSLVFSSHRIHKKYVARKEQKIVFYSIRGYNCFGIVKGNYGRIWADRTLIEKGRSLTIHVLDPLISLGIQGVKVDTLPLQDFKLEFASLTLHYLHKISDQMKTEEVGKDGYVYIINTCMKRHNSLPFAGGKLIILPRQSCSSPLEMHTKVWDLQQNGALEINI